MGASSKRESIMAAPIMRAPSGLLQRKCACGTHTVAGGECESCRKEKASGQLQRAPTQQDSVTEVPSVVHDVLRSSGQPLDSQTRAFMESRFAHDFSHVRVHTDAKAAESADAVSALAYTFGRDIVFGAGQYAPGASEGRRLIAHELTHVLQQPDNRNDLETVNSIVDPRDTTEAEADRMAWEITGARPPAGRVGFGSEGSVVGGAAARLSASPLSIQRDERPWPFNGYVINNSGEPVVVWSDGKGLYLIPAKSTSGRFTEDVDHIKDKAGNWYKIGPNTVTVDKDGSVSGYKCKVAKYNEDCPAK